MLKFLLVAGLACAIGFGAGFTTGWRIRLDDPVLVMQSQLREVVSSQISATLLSLNVLRAVEKDDLGKAKSQLARQIAEYQQSWAKYDGVLPKRPKLLPLIQDSINESPALREELAHRSN
jgi:hypothetical protein